MTEVIGSGLEVVGTLRYFMDYPDSPHSAPGYITHQFNPASWDHAGEAAGEHKLCRLSDAEAIIDGLRGEVADLHTTMMAAAVEIQEHWAAHCDEEGYGPANLMHRLERGIASQYGYSAETLVRLESQRDQHAKRIGELEGLLRHAQKQVPTGSGLHMRIDAALSAVCAAAPNIATTSEHSSQPERDPCPMCIKGGICNTPTCGRLRAMPKAY